MFVRGDKAARRSKAACGSKTNSDSYGFMRYSARMSVTSFCIDLGTMLFAALYSSCFFRRLSVSWMARRIESVMLVSVENHRSHHIARGAAGGLDKGSVRPQETLVVRVQNGYKRYFRDIQTFPQQVYSNQDVEIPEPQIADRFNPLDGVDVRVHIADPDVDLGKVFGQVLGHSLGERGNQDAMAFLNLLSDFAYQIVNLEIGRGALRCRGSTRPVGLMICSMTRPLVLASS